MKKLFINEFLVLLLIVIMYSCSTNPIEKIQGVYMVNKTALKGLLQKEMDNESAFALTLLNTAIENSIIEFEIKDDSIRGLIFLVGESTLINSNISVRNDSLVIKVGESEAYLIPSDTGLFYKNSGSERSIELTKSKEEKLSTEAEKAMVTIKEAELEKEKFEKSLGQWQEGYFVDEFGDKTGEGYAFSIIRGIHQNSISSDNEVYIKASIQDKTMCFQIFNSTMSFKESFPDSKFGQIKIKYEDGNVRSERIFFYNNMASESPYDNNNLIYSHILNNTSVLKLLIDLSTANEYYSDKYQFAIQQNNLLEILKSLK